MNRPKKKRGPQVAAMLAWALVGLLACSYAQAQNSSVEDLLDLSYHAMYNLQFDEALNKAEAAKAVAKDDPLPWMTQACAVLFREFDRLHILNSEMFSSDEKFASRSAQNWNPSSRKE